MNSHLESSCQRVHCQVLVADDRDWRSHATQPGSWVVHLYMRKCVHAGVHVHVDVNVHTNCSLTFTV